MKTKTVNRGSLHAVVGRRELEPSVERKWWVVEYVTSLVPCCKTEERHDSKKAALARRAELAKNYFYVAVAEVVERRTTLVRHDGTKPPNGALKGQRREVKQP